MKNNIFKSLVLSIAFVFIGSIHAAVNEDALRLYLFAGVDISVVLNTARGKENELLRFINNDDFRNLLRCRLVYAGNAPTVWARYHTLKQELEKTRFSFWSRVFGNLARRVRNS